MSLSRRAPIVRIIFSSLTALIVLGGCQEGEQLRPVRPFATSYRLLTRLEGSDCQLTGLSFAPRQESSVRFGRTEEGQLRWEQQVGEDRLWTFDASICRPEEGAPRICLAGTIRESYEVHRELCIQRLVIPAEQPQQLPPSCCGEAPEGFVLEADGDGTLRGTESVRWRQALCGHLLDCRLELSLQATPD